MEGGRERSHTVGSSDGKELEVLMYRMQETGLVCLSPCGRFSANATSGLIPQLKFKKPCIVPAKALYLGRKETLSQDRPLHQNEQFYR